MQWSPQEIKVTAKGYSCANYWPQECSSFLTLPLKDNGMRDSYLAFSDLNSTFLPQNCPEVASPLKYPIFSGCVSGLWSPWVQLSSWLSFTAAAGHAAALPALSSDFAVAFPLATMVLSWLIGHVHVLREINECIFRLKKISELSCVSEFSSVFC